MFNETLFILHIFVLVLFVLAALRQGRDTLVACFIVQVILANLFVTKQMECLGLTVTCSDVYTVGALFSLNLLQEYHGEAVAKRMIATLSLLLSFFVIMGQLHLSYQPAAADTTALAFETLLASTPRIIAASFAVTLFVQRCDIALFGWLKRRFFRLSLGVRFAIAALITQFVDTVLFTFFGLYGLLHSLFDVITMSYLIKVGVIASLAPFTALARRLVPTVEEW